MKKLPIGIQAFAELIDPAENYVYIDKTEILCDLAHSGKYYFLSRPRRFGKSVLLSTLYELFSANKSLFKGLYAENNWDWNTSYPVIRISFGGGSYATDEQFTCQLTRIMADNQEKLHITCDPETDTTTCFHELIKKSCQKHGTRVVVLIDEYDKPILDHITDKETARFNRDKLKGFYRILKRKQLCQLLMVVKAESLYGG